MATTSGGIVYPVASDFIAPLNTHLQNLAESTQTALDAIVPAPIVEYTPTFSNLSIGNGTIFASYAKVGPIIVDEITIIFGSTTTLSGNLTISGMQPAQYKGTQMQVGNVVFVDVGGSFYYGLAQQESSTSIAIYAQNTSSTFMTSSSLSATVPFTWAVNDRITIRTVRLAE